MNGLEMLAAVCDHAGRAFDVDPARIVLQRVCSHDTSSRRERLAILRLPPEASGRRIAMVYLSWVLIGGEWIQIEAFSGPVQ